MVNDIKLLLLKWDRDSKSEEEKKKRETSVQQRERDI